MYRTLPSIHEPLPELQARLRRARGTEAGARLSDEFPPLINEIAASLGAQLATRKEQFIKRQLADAAARRKRS